MHRRVAVALAAVLAAASVMPAAHADVGPMSADRDNGGWTDGVGIGASAAASSTEADGPSASSSGSVRHTPPVCRYERLSDDEVKTAVDMAAQGWGPSPGTGPGTWYRKICAGANGMTDASIVWAKQRQTADPVEVARRALGYAELVSPQIRLSPPAGIDQLVGVPTWLWLDGAAWSPVQASASVDGVTVTTTARPRQVTWSMGDGNSVTCSGPGTAYDPSHPDGVPSCSYVYRRSSATAPSGTFTVTATESWRVTWAASGASAGAADPGDGSLGTVTRSSTVAVRVAESQAINTGGS